MATKKSAKKSTKKIAKKIKEVSSYLVVCADCKIQLGVSKEDAFKCLLCGSENISREPLK